MEKILSVAKILILVCFLFETPVFSQIGIGTTTPDASSILDVTSTNKGFLTPRMTTAQRNAISSPTNGLMVYDTDLRAFEYYDGGTATWKKIYGDNEGRLKFKLIKSTDVLATVLAAELAAGGGTKYLLDTSTLYEINGTVYADFPVEINNAYIVGLDSGEDKLIRLSGDLFCWNYRRVTKSFDLCRFIRKSF